MMISNKERTNAIADFMARTDFNTNVEDTRTAKALKDMADERKAAEHKKREDKQKRKLRAEIRKQELEAKR